ncbi:hypothetical protein GCM10028800_18750 [Nesterenkonia populi]
MHHEQGKDHTHGRVGMDRHRAQAMPRAELGSRHGVTLVSDVPTATSDCSTGSPYDSSDSKTKLEATVHSLWDRALGSDREIPIAPPAAGFITEGLERQKLPYGTERFDVKTHARLRTVSNADLDLSEDYDKLVRQTASQRNVIPMSAAVASAKIHGILHVGRLSDLIELAQGCRLRQ